MKEEADSHRGFYICLGVAIAVHLFMAGCAFKSLTVTAEDGRLNPSISLSPQSVP